MAKRARRPRVARMGSGGSLLPSGDGLGQLALGHGRAAPDPELAGPAEQLVLAVAVDVQAPVRLPAGLAVAARRARVGRALGPWAPSGRRPSRTCASAPRTRSGALGGPPRTTPPRCRGPSPTCAAPSPASA